MELKKSLISTFGMNQVLQKGLDLQGELVLEWELIIWELISSQEVAQRRKQLAWWNYFLMEFFPQWEGTENWTS